MTKHRKGHHSTMHGGSGDGSGMAHPGGTSAQVHVAVGSGSRPGKGKHPIDTSAPSDHHHLGRAPKGGYLE